jgi:hypothetical protein
MNARLRKVTRNPRPVPITEQAAIKVLYLAVRDLQDYRSPNTGIRSSGWNRHSRHSRSTPTDESQPRDRHDHLHNGSDAPCCVGGMHCGRGLTGTVSLGQSQSRCWNSPV